jgi:hypothetical protein
MYFLTKKMIFNCFQHILLINLKNPIDIIKLFGKIINYITYHTKHKLLYI